MIFIKKHCAAPPKPLPVQKVEDNLERKAEIENNKPVAPSI
jgi:hypothetical protein